MQIRYIKSDADFENFSVKWNELLRSSPANSIFLTWEWLFCWWRVFKDKNKQLLIVCVLDDNGDLIALAPLMQEKKYYFKCIPVSSVRFLATGENEEDEICTEYLDFIISENADPNVVISFILDSLLDDIQIDYLLFENVLDSSILFKYLNDSHPQCTNKQISFKEKSYYLELHEDWDCFLEKLSSNQRYRIRRSLKEFGKSGDIEFSIVQDKEKLQETLDTLIDLHQKRWNAKGQSGVFSSKLFYRFHIDLMNLLILKGNLMLASLTVNGETIAVIYNFIYDGVVSFYQSGINTNLSNNKLRPGLAIHALAIKSAIEMKAKEYDFLLGESEYKKQWSKSAKSVSEIQLSRKNLKAFFIQPLLPLKKGT